MESPNHTNPSSINDTDSSSKIEAIKNLIFGDNIKAYNSEFDALKVDIRKNEEITEEHLALIEQRIDSLETDFQIRLTKLEERIDQSFQNISNNRKELSDLFLQIGNQLSS